MVGLDEWFDKILNNPQVYGPSLLSDGPSSCFYMFITGLSAGLDGRYSDRLLTNQTGRGR